MKRCRVCGERKSIEQFYKHPGMSDGHLSACKDCKKEYQMKYRIKNIDKVRKYDRERSSLEHRKAHLRANSDTWKKKHPEKYKAGNAVNNAVRDGKMIKPDRCQECGRVSKKLHGHHEDYNKPLEVLWLCPPCHGKRLSSFLGSADDS